MSETNYNRTSKEIHDEVTRGNPFVTPGSLRIGPGANGPVDEVELLKYARKIMGRRDNVDDGERLRR